MYDERFMDGNKNVLITEIAKIMDIETYYEAQIVWEQMLAKYLGLFLTKNDDIKVSFDFNKDNFVLTIPSKKIKKIMNKYDSKTKDEMLSFVWLLNYYNDKDYQEYQQLKKEYNN